MVDGQGRTVVSKIRWSGILKQHCGWCTWLGQPPAEYMFWWEAWDLGNMPLVSRVLNNLYAQEVCKQWRRHERPTRPCGFSVVVGTGTFLKSALLELKYHFSDFETCLLKLAHIAINFFHWWNKMCSMNLDVEERGLTTQQSSVVVYEK